MAQTDQTNVSEPVQDLRAEAWQETRRDTGGQAQTEYSQPGPESHASGRARYTMANAESVTERLGTGLVSGVANVAGGVIGAVRDTANTAIDGVGSVGEHAVHTLTGLLVEVVGGVRQIAGAAVGGVRSTAQEAFRSQEASYPQQQYYAQEAPQAQEARREPPPRRETVSTEQALH